MVHPHVMGEIRHRRFAEERPEHPWNVEIHPGDVALEELSMARVVKHQHEWAEKMDDEPEVQRGQPPSKWPREEKKGPCGNDRRGEQRHQPEKGRVSLVAQETRRHAIE